MLLVAAGPGAFFFPAAAGGSIPGQALPGGEARCPGAAAAGPASPLPLRVPLQHRRHQENRG